MLQSTAKTNPTQDARNRRRGSDLPLLAICLLASLSGLAQERARLSSAAIDQDFPVAVEPAYRETEINLTEWNRQKQLLFQKLQAERVAGAEDFAATYYPVAEEPASKKASPRLRSGEEKLIKVGAIMATDLRVSFAGADLRQKWSSQSIGMLKSSEDGFVWTGILESEGASALRLHFQNFDLPEGAALYLYNEHGQAQGPYLGSGLDEDGEFWSHTIFGERIVLQLHAEKDADLESARFTIAEIAPMNERFLLAHRYNHRVAQKLCNYNADCVQNAMCQSGFNTFKKAAAHIQFIEGGSSYICSGALLNDNASGAIPWFATANHCVGGQNVAETVEAFFRYQSDCGSCNDSLNGVPSVVGADLRAHGEEGDFSLLELSGFPSGGYGLLGWTTSTVRDDDGKTIHIIGHPKGAPQAYMEGEVDTDRYSNNKTVYSINVYGAHEGGSSGSGTIIQGGYWVGPYLGIAYSGSYDRCDSNSFRSRTGAFSHYKDSILPYLNPGNNYPLHVTDVQVKVTGSFIKFFKIIVTVKDEIGNAVPHARVYVRAGGTTMNGTTGGAGKAKFQIPKIQNNITACVTNITHGYFSYDEANNVETCDSN